MRWIVNFLKKLSKQSKTEADLKASKFPAKWVTKEDKHPRKPSYKLPEDLVAKFTKAGLSYTEIEDLLRILYGEEWFKKRKDLTRSYLLDDILDRGSRSHGSRSSSPISDKRFKKKIRPLSGALSKVLALRGVSFEWRQHEYPEMNFDAKRHVGFIAQEVEDVIPEVVDTNPAGYKSVQYANLTALLVEAIKEQQMQIEELKARISAIETTERGQVFRFHLVK